MLPWHASSDRSRCARRCISRCSGRFACCRL